MNLSPKDVAPPVAFVLIGSILLVIGIIGVIPLGNPYITISDQISKTILIVIGILLIGSGPIFIWREQKTSAKPEEANSEFLQKYLRGRKQDNDGINVFFANRKHLQPLEELIQNARKEIIFYSVQHSYLVHHGLDILKNKLESGCKVKILMMAAKNHEDEINPNVLESESHRTYSGLLPQIESSTDSFKKWASALNESTKKLLEIRVYQECPIMTLLIIDRDEPHGILQGEILLYGVDVGKMPHYILTKKKGSNLFNTHCESFDCLWSKSDVLQLES